MSEDGRPFQTASELFSATIVLARTGDNGTIRDIVQVSKQ